MHPDLDPRHSSIARLLRELPGDGTPPYGYAEFERRAAVRQRQARTERGGRRMALAGAVVLGVLAILWRLVATPPAIPSNVRAGPDSEALTPQGEDAIRATRAQVADRWLAALPKEPAVSRFGSSAAVMGLEDRIAQVDDLLTSTHGAGNAIDRRRALQQERARLVATLVQVRYAQTLANYPP